MVTFKATEKKILMDKFLFKNSQIKQRNTIFI